MLKGAEETLVDARPAMKGSKLSTSTYTCKTYTLPPHRDDVKVKRVRVIIEQRRGEETTLNFITFHEQ